MYAIKIDNSNQILIPNKHLSRKLCFQYITFPFMQYIFDIFHKLFNCHPSSNHYLLSNTYLRKVPLKNMHMNILKLYRKETSKKVYNYYVQHTFQPMDNDGPFSLYITRKLSNDGLLVALSDHIFYNICKQSNSKSYHNLAKIHNYHTLHD